MSSEDYRDKITLKGHVMDERGQLYVINSRGRTRVGRKLTAAISCTHVMFKLTDFKIPYASYIKEGYGMALSQLTAIITAATNGRFTFVIHDTFPLFDVKDWGGTNALAALNDLINMYGAEIEPDNFVIHIRKKIGANNGHQYRLGKNVISSAFKDDGSTLTTRLFAQMKDGRTWIGQPASILTVDERSRLATIPGAIVNGNLAVNYLVSQYASAWSTPDIAYYDNELIEQNITDVTELLRQARRELEDSEVPAFEVSVSAADVFKLDDSETRPNLGDTVYCVDPEMELPNITARITEITEFPFDIDKHTQVTVANVMSRDFAGILADLDRSKRIINDIMSGGTIRTEVFEAFAKQAITDIDNSKTELKYPEEGGILAQDKLNPLRQVRLTSAGLGISTDGWQTLRAAVTADGIVGERIIGQIGNFESLSVGGGNNIILLNRTAGLSAGHATFSSAPFRVDFQGNVTARSITLTGKIEASEIFEGTITGALLRTAATGARVEIDASGWRTYDASNVKRISILADDLFGMSAIQWAGTSGSNVGTINGANSLFSIMSPTQMLIASTGGGITLQGGVTFSSGSVTGLTTGSIAGLGAQLYELSSDIEDKAWASEAAYNLVFDSGTRNLKMYTRGGSLLAQVNIS